MGFGYSGDAPGSWGKSRGMVVRPMRAPCASSYTTSWAQGPVWVSGGEGGGVLESQFGGETMFGDSGKLIRASFILCVGVQSSGVRWLPPAAVFWTNQHSDHFLMGTDRYRMNFMSLYHQNLTGRKWFIQSRIRVRGDRDSHHQNVGSRTCFTVPPPLAQAPRR